MKISFDAQPLVDSQKTGIGFCEAGITKALLKQDAGHEYYFEYFSFKNASGKRANLAEFSDAGGILKDCPWFPGSLYRLVWNFVPVPYHWFFGKKSNVTHFFNYHVPPGVHGKKVATVHDMSCKTFPETMRLKTRIMLNISLARSCGRADKVITDSQFSKQEIIRFLNIPADKIVVAPCGVDTEAFHPVRDSVQVDAVKEKYGIRSDYFLYMGTLEPRKNIERLIEAYASLIKDDPHTPILVLAGRKGWLYDSIFERVKTLKLEDRVIFTGYVAETDVPTLISGALAFVFPSLYEGFGMPPLEAMACGTPVLTSNCSSLPEVVGDAAILIDPYSTEDIARGLSRLMSDENLREELSKMGIERAKLFTWENSAEIVMSVYKELSGK